MSGAQVWDIVAVTLEKVHYRLPRWRCGCGKTTTAAPPFGAAGTVTYGPHVNAAAILLASEGNVPIERTAALMAMMLSAPVSAGFVARALERFAQRLEHSGFDEAMKAALGAQDVLCADETPTNVISKNTDEHGQPVPGSPHAVTVGTPDARLVWYAAMGSRSKTDIAGLGVLDSYAGYLSETTTPAGTSSTPNSGCWCRCWTARNRTRCGIGWPQRLPRRQGSRRDCGMTWVTCIR